MAMNYSVETPVHVSEYWRFRLMQWEFVPEYYRRKPNK